MGNENDGKTVTPQFAIDEEGVPQISGARRLRKKVEDLERHEREFPPPVDKTKWNRRYD